MKYKWKESCYHFEGLWYLRFTLKTDCGELVHVTDDTFCEEWTWQIGRTKSKVVYGSACAAQVAALAVLKSRLKKSLEGLDTVVNYDTKTKETP